MYVCVLGGGVTTKWSHAPGRVYTVSYKQSSWSLARNLQENRPFLTASGVGTRSPTWTIAVSWEKALNLHTSKCQLPNHSWVDWWGWWEADGKLDGKVALSQGHNHYTTQTRTHTHNATPKNLLKTNTCTIRETLQETKTQACNDSYPLSQWICRESNSPYNFVFVLIVCFHVLMFMYIHV